MARHSNYEDSSFEPRNERALCALFSDMIFTRFEKGLSRAKLSTQGEQNLLASNLINRIFRAWYQITWGDRNWTDAFIGETPRQELSAKYPDIESGDAMLSVALEKFIMSPYVGNEEVGTQLEVVSKLFTKKDLRSAGGAFLYGLAELNKHEKGVVAPNYENGFRSFAERLQKIKVMAESLPSYALRGTPDEIVYWRLFIEDAASNILASLPLTIRKGDRHKIYEEFTTTLLGSMGLQKDGEFEYCEIDTLFGFFWELFSRYDHELIPYEEMLGRDSAPSDKGSRPLDRSRALLYRLGYAFDEQFLFPADRYFNAVEIVWQDKMTFLTNLYATIGMLNNNETKASFDEKTDPILREMFDVTHTTGTLENLFFNPPTCYRVHDWALSIV